MNIEISEEAQQRLASVAKRRRVDIATEVEDLIGQLPDVDLAPNQEMLAIIEQMEKSHKDRPFSGGSQTQRLIREARGGPVL